MKPIDEMTVEELRLEIAKAKEWTNVQLVYRLGNSNLYRGTPPNVEPGKFLDPLPRWDTSIGDAWELVEEVKSTGAYVNIDFDLERNIHEFSASKAWMCIMAYTDPEKDSVIAEAETAMLAICRAYLAWKTGDQNNL